MPERGCGAANCVLEVVVEVDGGSSENAEPDGAEIVLEVAAGAGADWKSSNSSSSTGVAKDPKSFEAGALLEEAMGAIGSSSKLNRSTSGSFAFVFGGGAAAFLASRLDEDGEDGASFFLRLVVDPGPSSYSSYSSNLSLFRPPVS